MFKVVQTFIYHESAVCFYSYFVIPLRVPSKIFYLEKEKKRLKKSRKKTVVTFNTSCFENYELY